MHAERRARVSGTKPSARVIRKGTNNSISPSKLKRRKRLIINGESPVKLSNQGSAPVKDKNALDMDQFEVKLFLQSS